MRNQFKKPYAKKHTLTMIQKMFIFLVLSFPVILWAMPKLPTAEISLQNEKLLTALDNELNSKRHAILKRKLNRFSKTKKFIENIKSGKKWPVESIRRSISADATFVENQFKDIKDINYATKVFDEYVKTIGKLLQDRKAAQNDGIRFHALFQGKGKLFQIEGDGETNTIADNALISLNLCQISHNPKMSFLDGIAFLKCAYTKFPPKYAATKLRPHEIEWIYPLLPGINTYQIARNGAFLFPDLEALTELDKGAFGLLLSLDRKHSKQRKLADIRKFFFRLLHIVFTDNIKKRLNALHHYHHHHHRQKREIPSIEELLEPENDLSLMAQDIHNLKDEAAVAAKATEGIDKINRTGDFWIQLRDKAVTILHYIMGIDKREAESAMNNTVGLARDLVNHLAIIKQSIDETQSVMKKNMRNIALNVMKKSFGKENAGVASDFLEMINNLEKTRKNLKTLVE